MKHSVWPLLGAAAALTLLSLSALAVSPVHAFVQEIHLNSSNVQVVHNTAASADVLNMSLNVTSDGELGGCEGEDDDLLESGVTVGVYGGSCLQFFFTCISVGCPTLPFDFTVNPYVEHEIGSSSYGTFFGLNGSGTVSSKIVSLATPPNTCGRRLGSVLLRRERADRQWNHQAAFRRASRSPLSHETRLFRHRTRQVWAT